MPDLRMSYEEAARHLSATQRRAAEARPWTADIPVGYAASKGADRASIWDTYYGTRRS